MLYNQIKQFKSLLFRITMNPSKRNQKQTVIDIFNRKADDRIQRKQTQKQLLAAIQEKNTQLSVLSHVNTRLGAQLVILQRKLGIDHDTVLKQLQQVNQISAAFHFETQQLQYLDALLTAYDQNNLKQKKLIAHLYSSLEDSEKKAQNLIKDNQFLLGQLQEKTKQILQIYSKGFIDDNLTSSYSKLQRETQLQLMENLRVENQYLLKNYRVIEGQFQKRQDELKQSKSKIQYYYELYKKQVDDLKNSTMKIDDLIKIKDVLQKKFDEITQENIEFQTLRQHLQAKLTRIQGQNKQLRNQFHLQRTLKHQEIQRIGQQFETLKFQHEGSQKRERQYFNKNMLLERDLQSHKEDLKMVKRQLQKIKSDFEQTLKMCEAYETKISTYSKKQKIMMENVEDNKQKLENALLERDKALMKQKNLQKTIENLKERNRDEIEALKNTFQKVIFEQNEKIKILEEDKDDANSVFYQNQVSLKHQVQKLKRENQMIKDQNYRYAQNIKTNSGHEIVNRLKQLQEKNQTLNRLVNQKQRSYREDIDHKEEIIRNLQTENRDIARQVDRQRASARQAINEKTQLKSRISILQKQKQCLEQQISRLKRAIDSKASASSEQKQSKIRELEQKLKETERKYQDLRQKTIKLFQQHDQKTQKVVLQYEQQINQLKSQINKLQRKMEKQKKQKK